MLFWEIFLLAIGLSMDAFAVAICKGLSAHQLRAGNVIKCGVWFGIFQAAMPLGGFFLGSLFAAQIAAFDHWVAFALLVLIGLNMLREVFSKKDEPCNGDFGFKTMLPLAVATSIDALVVGVSLAMTAPVNIWLDITIIGITTAVLSGIGVVVGSLFGSKFEKQAQVLGGIILILLGIKVLVEHLIIA